MTLWMTPQRLAAVTQHGPVPSSSCLAHVALFLFVAPGVASDVRHVGTVKTQALTTDVVCVLSGMWRFMLGWDHVRESLLCPKLLCPSGLACWLTAAVCEFLLCVVHQELCVSDNRGVIVGCTHTPLDHAAQA